MSLPDSAQVLIVGGGPTGLVLALALHKHGCPDVVVVDAVTQGENSSRAVAIHAATIEALEEVGVADQLVNAGEKVLRTTTWFGRGAPIDTTYFPPLAKYTKYPFILAFPQHVTERALAAEAQKRGIEVHRPYKVVDMKPNADDHTLIDVVFENGHVLHTRCVVGADGSRSTVRRLANVAWADPSGQADANKDEAVLANMFVADVTLSNPPPFPHDAINLIVANDSRGVLFIRLPETTYPSAGPEPVFRIAGEFHPSLGTPAAAPSTEYLQKLFDLWGPNQVLPADTPRVEITKTLWASRFRTHSAIADRFFTHVPPQDPAGPEGGPVFLLGDAAHIHPPMGGQGMNLGIRDGVRLAPLLTAYIRSASASGPSSAEELERPLRAWAAERRERALTVIRGVKGLQRLMELPNEWRWFLGIIPYNLAALRNAFMRFVTSFEWWRARVAYQMSGLGNR